MNHMILIGSSATRAAESNAIVDQGILQLNNPILPSSVKQQLFTALTQVDAYGRDFNDAPVAIYNMLILQIKAALVHAVVGNALATPTSFSLLQDLWPRSSSSTSDSIFLW